MPTAIAALGRIGPGAHSALPVILERLERYPLIVATAIAETESVTPDIVERLVKLTASDDPLARAEAIAALGELGEAAAPALPTLLSRLEDADSYEVDQWSSHGISTYKERVTVAESVPATLEKIGPAAVPGLIQALSHAEKDVRRLAIAALERIDGSREDAAIPLGVALSDDDADYRAAAAQTLASIGPGAAAAADQLVRMFQSDPESDNRVVAAHALGQLGEVSVVPVLIEGTRHPDPEVRASAIGALGQLGPIAVMSVPAIVAALNDDAHRVKWISNDFATTAPIRLDAIESLRQIGPAAWEAVEDLAEMLNEEQGPTRVAVACALGRIDREKAIDGATHSDRWCHPQHPPNGAVHGKAAMTAGASHGEKVPATD